MIKYEMSSAISPGGSGGSFGCGGGRYVPQPGLSVVTTRATAPSLLHKTTTLLWKTSLTHLLLENVLLFTLVWFVSLDRLGFFYMQYGRRVVAALMLRVSGSRLDFRIYYQISFFFSKFTIQNFFESVASIFLVWLQFLDSTVVIYKMLNIVFGVVCFFLYIYKN